MVRREMMEPFETVEQFVAYLCKKVDELNEPILAVFTPKIELIISPSDEAPNIMRRYEMEESSQQRKQCG